MGLPASENLGAVLRIHVKNGCGNRNLSSKCWGGRQVDLGIHWLPT